MTSTSERDSALQDPPLPDITAVDSLKMLLDYAMTEGSELGLPVFVDLLRMASLELDRRVACRPASVSRRSSHQARRTVS